jgi:predicted metal-dependent hydrolase
LTYDNAVFSRRHYYFLDSTTDIIRVSKILDDKRVPIYVLDYIVYHELLHIKHETVYRNCRRTVHTKEFKKDEKRYEEYESANRWLKANIWRRGRYTIVNRKYETIVPIN